MKQEKQKTIQKTIQNLRRITSDETRGEGENRSSVSTWVVETKGRTESEVLKRVLKRDVKAVSSQLQRPATNGIVLTVE